MRFQNLFYAIRTLPPEILHRTKSGGGDGRGQLESRVPAPKVGVSTRDPSVILWLSFLAI